ncbi:TraB/GumN family protein [Porphyrobacter sp. CACIAM 03H1]|uniref:TraB/GumN family protein n=1 Tax=Porphyrobacter sp. CACIAM 03H1 TaxID=2003315 RepID=UPI000B5AA3CB|nr:TraB/GumN family protein [Porphyrobacter sp. CACIAM 03H1]ASJ91279.1 TraB/GumN family protein [Porphyrobacter sp. CACIAM 03H1]
MKLATLFSLAVAPLALLAANPALAQDHAGHTAAAPAGKGPALWKVADEDTTIYLFGTVHVLPKDLEWYDATIAEAFDSSGTIVTEIPMDAASEAQMAQLTQAKGMLPAGTTLRSLLNAEQTAAYTAAMGKIGIPVEAFDPVKPWLAGLTLSILPLMQQGYDPNSGVEKVLLAKAEGKEKGALETAEFQLSIFDGMTQEAQVAFMMEAATGIDEVKPTLDRMVAEWAKGDADRLAEVMNEGMSDPAVAEALLYKRNANWAEWIDTRLDTPGTVFIAVGAGHLAGAKSVQDYLAQKGIAVTRVK